MQASKRAFKKGGLYKLVWRDAIYYSNIGDVEPVVFKNGGEYLTMVAWIIDFNAKSILTCAEYDQAGNPHRDINVIPLDLLVSAYRLDTKLKNCRINL